MNSSEQVGLQDLIIEWMRFSLSAAMQEIEDEISPAYILADLKIVFA
jgi:hypothetical protein